MSSVDVPSTSAETEKRLSFGDSFLEQWDSNGDRKLDAHEIGKGLEKLGLGNINDIGMKPDETVDLASKGRVSALRDKLQKLQAVRQALRKADEERQVKAIERKHQEEERIRAEAEERRQREQERLRKEAEQAQVQRQRLEEATRLFEQAQEKKRLEEEATAAKLKLEQEKKKQLETANSKPELEKRQVEEHVALKLDLDQAGLEIEQGEKQVEPLLIAKSAQEPREEKENLEQENKLVKEASTILEQDEGKDVEEGANIEKGHENKHITGETGLVEETPTPNTERENPLQQTHCDGKDAHGTLGTIKAVDFVDATQPESDEIIQLNEEEKPKMTIKSPQVEERKEKEIVKDIITETKTVPMEGDVARVENKQGVEAQAINVEQKESELLLNGETGDEKKVEQVVNMKANKPVTQRTKRETTEGSRVSKRSSAKTGAQVKKVTRTVKNQNAPRPKSHAEAKAIKAVASIPETLQHQTKEGLIEIVTSLMEGQLKKRDHKIDELRLSLDQVNKKLSQEEQRVRLPQVLHIAANNEDGLRKISSNKKLMLRKSQSRIPKPGRSNNSGTSNTLRDEHGRLVLNKSKLPRVAGIIPSNNNAVNNNSERREDNGSNETSQEEEKAKIKTSKVRYPECKSAVFAPSNAIDQSKGAGSLPQESLELEFIHGFHNTHSGQRLQYLALTKEWLYPVSATVVMFDTASRKQTFFQRHSDNVTAVAANPVRDIIASAQLERNASILVWNREAKEVCSTLEFHDGIVTCLDFSADGRLLLSCGGSIHRTIVVWDWENGVKLSCVRSNATDISLVRWHPYQYMGLSETFETSAQYTFITCGKKHIRFWTADFVGSSDGNGMNKNGTWNIEGNTARLGKVFQGPVSSLAISSLCFIAKSGLCITGTQDGSLLFWSQSYQSKTSDEGATKVVKNRWAPKGKCIGMWTGVHSGAILDLRYCSNTNQLAIASKDRELSIYIIDHTKDPLKEPERDSETAPTWIQCVRRVKILPHVCSGGYAKTLTWLENGAAIGFGTNTNCLVRYELAEDLFTNVVRSHHTVISGVACHPFDAHTFLSASTDGTLKLWDLTEKRMKAHLKLPDKGVSVTVHPDGSCAAVGLVPGNVLIVCLEKKRMGKSGLQLLDVIHTISLETKPHNHPQDGEEGLVDTSPRKRRVLRRSATSDLSTNTNTAKDIPTTNVVSSSKAVHIVAFSPLGSFLAVAQRDMSITILDVKNGYRRLCVCKGHSSQVMSLDWTTDERVLQSSDAASELLYLERQVDPKSKRVRFKQTASAYHLRDENWSSWTSTLGWPVQGIWRSEHDFANIGCVDRSSGEALLATGDEANTLSLFRYPCLKQPKNDLGAKRKDYYGHSGRIAQVKFSNDDSHLLSTGSKDGSLFQWRVSV